MYGKRVGKHHFAPQRPLAGAERLCDLDQFRLDAARAFDCVVEHREYREQKDHQHLGRKAEAHHRQDERDQRHHRRRVNNHDIGLDANAQRDALARAACRAACRSAAAITKPVKNRVAESANCLKKSPPTMSCHSLRRVSQNGTMKAALVAAAGGLPKRDADKDADPERDVAADGLVHVCHLFSVVTARTAGDPVARRAVILCTGAMVSRSTRDLTRAPRRQDQVAYFTMALASFQMLASTRLSNVTGSLSGLMAPIFFIRLAVASSLLRGRPSSLTAQKLDVEEVLQRLFVHFLAVSGVGRDFCHGISVFRVLHETRGLDHSGNRAHKGVAIGLHVVLTRDQHQIVAGRIGVFHGQQNIELLALSLDLGEVVEMQHGVVQAAGNAGPVRGPTRARPASRPRSSCRGSRP